MKQDFTKEFDLQDIYNRLVAPSTYGFVPASKFFDNDDGLLQKFQQKMATATKVIACKK